MENKQFLHSKILPDDAMEKLSAAHVAVFGLGGAGSWCAEALARAGVGTLTLADDGIVSPAHLNRQVQATQSAIGQPKAIAMSVRLREINPNGKFIPKCFRYSADGREDFFPAGYHYVVDAIGQGPCKLDLIETAMSFNMPIVSTLNVGSTLNASRFQIADISEAAAFPQADGFRTELLNRGIDHLKVVFSPESASETETPRSAPACVSWTSPVAGFLLAQTVILDLIER